MKRCLLVFVSLIVLVMLSCNQEKLKATTEISEINKVVEASCGQCNFKLKTQKGCDLAVRIDGKAYFVDGSDIDDHGDAHAEEGFCNAISKAKVKGEIIKGRFKASEFKLLDN
jgi:hypothetical protein